jgi:hypothetical protein
MTSEARLPLHAKNPFPSLALVPVARRSAPNLLCGGGLSVAAGRIAPRCDAAKPEGTSARRDWAAPAAGGV